MNRRCRRQFLPTASYGGSLLHLDDIEFQMHPPLSFARLETYAAVLIKQGIRPGEDYSKLRDAWVIFITKERHWSDTGEEIFKDKPVRRFELAEVLDNNQLKLVENAHYHLFVANALYDGDDPLGDLMRDLSTNQAAEVKMPALHESEKRFKEGKDYKIMFSTYTELVKEERAEMKKAQEEAKKAQEEVKALRAEAEEKLNQSIREYFRQGEKNVGLIAKVLDTSVEHVQKIQREMEKNLAKV